MGTSAIWIKVHRLSLVNTYFGCPCDWRWWSGFIVTTRDRNISREHISRWAGLKRLWFMHQNHDYRDYKKILSLTLNYSLSGCPLCSNFVSFTPWTLFSFIYVTLSENAYFGLAWKSGRRWHIFFLPGSLGVPMCPQSRGVATLSLIQWAGREMTSPFKRVLDSPPAVNTPIESMFSSYLCWKRGYRCKHKYSHTNGKGHLELMFTTNKNVCGLYMSNVLRNRNLWCDVGWLYLGWMGHTLTKAG